MGHDMTKTKYEGVYYTIGKDGRKIFKVRFWVYGKEYKRSVGKEPAINAKAAWLKREALIEQYTTGEVVEIGKLDDMFLRYLDERHIKMGKYWYKNNYYPYMKHVSPRIGRMRADAIKRHQVQAIVDDMLEKGYKPKTAKDIRDMLRAFFRYFDLPNAAEKVELPKFDNSVQFNLSLQECRNIFNAVMNYHDTKLRTYFIFLLHGRRKGETMTLKVENIDFENHLYTIEYGQNKRRKTVQHPLTPMLERAVAELMQEEGILSGYLFRNHRGDSHLPSQSIDNHWRKIKEVAGIETMRLHDLRHMIGYMGVSLGASLEQIGKVLDHTNIATTKRYSNVRAEQAGALLDDIFEKLGG